jgi:hypothetical protein
MDPDLKELLSALSAQSVKYLVVGGYAIGVHAEPRGRPRDLLDVDELREAAASGE